jgi:glycosyltransferase involved in cell wall biosynthesis
MNKRIAFYCSSVSWGGLEMNFVRYAEWIANEGYTVHVFCVADSPIHKRVLECGLTHTCIAFNKKYFDLKNAFKVAGLFDKEKIDLVWFRDTRDMSLLSWVKKFSSRKLKLIYQQAMQLGVDKKDLFHTLRFLSIDKWIATLNFLKEQVVNRTRFPHNRISVIPLGADTKQIHAKNITQSEARELLNLPKDALIAGIIGRIDPLKGQHITINALQICNDNTHLVVMGESTKNEGRDYEVELKQKVRSLGLQNRVHFKPYSKDVEAFYRAIDIFILASKGETFGTVTIEAMSFGLAIIGTDSSGTPEILDYGKAGLLFEPDNASELANCMKAYISNPTKRNEMGENAKARFNAHYSKEASVKRIVEEVLSCKL